MRILWCTVNRSHRVAQQFDIFRNTVKQFADVVELFKTPAGDHGENMWQLSRDLIDGKLKTDNIISDYLNKDNDFDFIFCDAFFAYTEEDWRHFGIPSGILIEDIHHGVPKRQIAIAKDHYIENIFHRFNFGFHKYHPEARYDFKCFWLPHSTDISKFKDNQSERKGVLHVGVHPKIYYPFRANVVEQLRKKRYFTHIPRPKEGGDKRLKWPINEDYINILNMAKICITGGSIFNAPVQKYVEIPAVGTLLMSNWFSDLGLLGYQDGHNMVAYNKENLVDKVEGLLKDNDKITKIANNGMKLIHSKHTSSIRAKQFINNICQIIGKESEYDIPPCSHQVNFNQGKVKLKPKIKKTKRVKVSTSTDWRSRIK